EAGDFIGFVGEAEEPFVVGWALLRAVFGDEIGETRAGDGGFEFVGLGDGPLGHVSAVGPAADAETGRIGDATIHEIVHSPHHILEVAAAPIAAIAFDEFLAVAHGTANIGIEDGVAARGEELSPSFDVVLPGTGGAAMDKSDKR